jgi:hypothetical protein
MIPDPELENELSGDIAIESAAKDDEPSSNEESGDGADEAELVEAQKDAAEERKEGGYQ